METPDGIERRFQDQDYDRPRSNYYSDRDEERKFEMKNRPKRYESSNTYWGNLGTEGKFSGKGPKGWRHSDDSIREDVCETLYLDSYIDASNIEVSVKDGCVCLTGKVDSRETKRAAEHCVENLSGVEDIQNELKITKNLISGQSNSSPKLS